LCLSPLPLLQIFFGYYLPIFDIYHSL
jgi:hypothetical protein